MNKTKEKETPAENSAGISKVVFAPENAEQVPGWVLKLSAITKVTNDEELKESEALIKSSKSLFKEIEFHRKAFTSKLDAVKADAMKFEKELRAAFEPVEALASSYVRKKELARLAKEQEIRDEQDRKMKAEQLKMKQKQNLVDFEFKTKEAIEGCKTMKQLESWREKLTAYKVEEAVFGEQLEAAKEMKKELLRLGDKKRKALESKKEFEVDMSSVQEKKEEVAMEGIQSMQDIEIETQAKTQSLGMVSGIRRVWAYEVKSFEDVPREYMTVDDVKVKAMIKAGTREIQGLKIFQDIARSGR